MFYAPSGIILGGFGGISTIISYWLSLAGINISISIIYLILNTILFIFALKILGPKFGAYAIVGILSYSLFLEVCKFPSIGGTDWLLCSIYGGVISGIGTGIIIRRGGSTGGGDMLGCIVNHKKPKISIGWVTICVNIVVISVALFVYGLNLSLYAIIAIFISGKSADLIIDGPKSVKAFYIISNKSDELANALIKDLHRGVTSFDAYGKYSGKKLEVILCLVSGFQVRTLKDMVYNVDPNAFLFSVSVKEAMGKGFNKLEKQKKLLISKKKVKLAQTLPDSQSFSHEPNTTLENPKDNTETEQD